MTSLFGEVVKKINTTINGFPIPEGTNAVYQADCGCLFYCRDHESFWTKCKKHNSIDLLLDIIDDYFLQEMTWDGKASHSCMSHQEYLFHFFGIQLNESIETASEKIRRFGKDDR